MTVNEWINKKWVNLNDWMWMNDGWRWMKQWMNDGWMNACMLKVRASPSRFSNSLCPQLWAKLSQLEIQPDLPPPKSPTTTLHLSRQTSRGAALKECEADFGSLPSFFKWEWFKVKTFPVCPPLQYPPEDLPEAASEAPLAGLNDALQAEKGTEGSLATWALTFSADTCCSHDGYISWEAWRTDEHRALPLPQET